MAMTLQRYYKGPAWGSGLEVNVGGTLVTNWQNPVVRLADGRVFLRSGYVITEDSVPSLPSLRVGGILSVPATSSSHIVGIQQTSDERVFCVTVAGTVHELEVPVVEGEDEEGDGTEEPVEEEEVDLGLNGIVSLVSLGSERVWSPEVGSVGQGCESFVMVGDVLYVGTIVGTVMKSDDFGASWITSASGIGASNRVRLGYIPQMNRLFALSGGVSALNIRVLNIDTGAWTTVTTGTGSTYGGQDPISDGNVVVVPQISNNLQVLNAAGGYILQNLVMLGIMTGHGAFGNGRFVVTYTNTDVTRGMVSVSDNGQIWTDVYTGFEMTSIQGLYYDGDFFVMLHSVNQIAISQDGSTWFNEKVPVSFTNTGRGQYNGTPWQGGFLVPTGSGKSVCIWAGAYKGSISEVTYAGGAFTEYMRIK